MDDRDLIQKRILVIDDQPDVLEMVSYILQCENYDVISATGGEDGILQAKVFKPDLVICDIMMPGMNGYEVLKALRVDADTISTPFIFLTARASSEELRNGMSHGADDYLTKPFDADELIDAVITRLQKHASVQETFEKRLEMLRQGISTVLPHELRTPLTIILAHSSLLLETRDSFSRDDVIRAIQAINEAGVRLHRLIENLLIYSQREGDETLKLEHPQLENPARLIESVVTGKAKEYHRSVELDIQKNIGPVRIHEFHLRKLVDELVDNAFKFSSGSSLVKVTAARLESDLHLRIEDHGRGMNTDEIEHIEAFVQFGRKRFEQQGGGFGLIVVKSLVNLYQGTITIDSEPGSSTTIQVNIPV